MELYKKYRPKTLGEVKGNFDVIQSLRKMLERNIPHSILFHGETGCGKTTLGRIIKNQLNVSNNDFFEINSSEMRGIDTIRDIIKKAQFRPVNSEYRIYLIDECHKLTNDAQNAFLKILEDTPSHIIFILCTTNPEKLIKAIRGRCQQFQVNLLKPLEMKSLLKNVSRKEKDKLDKEVLEQIVQDSEGQPRLGLQILQQVLNVEEENRLEVAKQTAYQTSQAIELCRALIGRKNWNEIKTILQGLETQEPETIRRIVLGYCKAILLKSDNERAGEVMEEFIEPFYNTGFPGLVFSCYSLYKN